MNTFISKNKIFSFLLLTLPTDGVSRVILNLTKGLVERGVKVDIVVLKAEGDALAWMQRGARVVELNTQIRGFHKLLFFSSSFEESVECEKYSFNCILLFQLFS